MTYDRSCVSTVLPKIVGTQILYLKKYIGDLGMMGIGITGNGNDGNRWNGERGI